MKKLLQLFILCLGITVSAQIKAPQPSPSAKVEQMVGLSTVTLDYSRPAMRGRTIFGDLVPFGEIWRTGANENTVISFSDDAKIDGKMLKAGKYAIYTIPNKDSWDVMFYKSTNNWGNPQNWDDNMVALKVKAEVVKIPMEMQSFTILIDEITTDGANLNFLWENTVAYIKFTVPTDEKTMASIDKVMNGPGAADYYAAAAYYHDAGKDLNKAWDWITKATEANPDAYWMQRKKSLIAADMGKKDKAIEAAKKSLAAAEKTGNKDYVKMNKDSLKEWGAK
ncbi:DUF2911 domain-containing protein [Zunongwangia endophytica]|uniref:DUF2911 domain-containing protein n=1 Tax=Zunongwangia endophytica TaxID=1808945 RepID=A0ABV8H1B4_9FLAO|nr:DUF2911 domain-containing protein [Zunongwangia endophytica]MDN3594548.1 DUF2911 domain-containing protein [Zunongwangia endophytica]